MLIEHHTRVDALDMSYVRFCECWRSMKKLLKTKRGDKATHADAIDDQIREKDG